MSIYEAMLAQYESSQNKGTKSTFNSEENLKNYFTTWIPDGIKSAQKTIRILPTSDKSSPFKSVKGHSIKVNGKTEKFLCPKDAEGKPCPFCEAREELLKKDGKTDTEIKQDFEIAKKYFQRDFFIVKVIDRDKEDEGPKFWRFPKDYTNKGVYDKIIDVVKAMGASVDITDATAGYDLVLGINRDQNNFPVVNSVLPKMGAPTPLHTNQELASVWLADTRIWSDVYKVKPYDYLELIVSGEVPYYDKENNRYIAKPKTDAQDNSFANEQNDINSLVNDSNNNSFGSDPVMFNSDNAETDDLPF